MNDDDTDGNNNRFVINIYLVVGSNIICGNSTTEMSASASRKELIDGDFFKLVRRLCEDGENQQKSGSGK